VFVWHAKTPDGPVGPYLETAREMMRDGDGPPALRSAYGPVPRPQEYPAPAEASAMIARRFGLLFEKRRDAS
jgi:hypothetical protein